MSANLSGVGVRSIISGLGGVYIGLAVAQALANAPSNALVETVIDFILVGGPGVILLGGGYLLPRTGLHPTVYSRILAWFLGGFGLLLGVVGLRVLDPGVTIDNPLESVVLATALGSVAGFTIGLYDARSISRARTAEQYSVALEQANEELEQQHQRLESLAGLLAHELRNPLQIAQIYHPQSHEGDATAATQVDHAHDRIEEMIDILLVTVRGHTGSTNIEPIPLAEVAREAWAAVTTDVVGGELVIETDQTVEADPAHLRYLFRQLIRNSLEHGGDDVTVRVGDLNDREGFYIADDGPGIPEGVRDDVVEAGFTTKPDGRGLGLTFAAQFADAFEWELRLTESAAGGTRVEFTGVTPVSTDEQVCRN